MGDGEGAGSCFAVVLLTSKFKKTSFRGLGGSPFIWSKRRQLNVNRLWTTMITLPNYRAWEKGGGEVDRHSYANYHTTIS